MPDVAPERFSEYLASDPPMLSHRNRQRPVLTLTAHPKWKGEALKRTSTIVFLICCSSLVLAQGSTYVGAGIGIPQRPAEFSSQWGVGLSLAGGIEAPVNDWFALLAGFDLSTFPLNEEKYIEAQGVVGTGVSVSGGSTGNLTLTVGARVRVAHTPKVFSAYVVGLFGYMNCSKKDLEVSQSGYAGTLAGEEKSSLCAGTGVGIETPVSKIMDGFIEGRYVIDFGPGNRAFIPIRAGVRIKL